MLHLLPFASELGRTTYVFGVATAAAFRGRGLATELLRRAETLCRERGDDALVLIPDGEGLREFYARLGYEGDLPVEFSAPDGFDFGTGESLRDRAMILPLRRERAVSERVLHLTWNETAAQATEPAATATA